MATTARFQTVVPADWVPGPPQGQWTYAEYTMIPDDGKRYEVLKGVLYISPAPTPNHQSISVRLVAFLFQFVEAAGIGRIFHAPTDVELAPGDIVQPDVFVLLNAGLEQIGEKRVFGGPDLVVEILSPSTMSDDLHGKRDAYERAQVSEYWIVNPGERVVELFILESGVYRSLGAFQGDDVLPTRIVPGWSVPVERLFAFV
ncbi:MAG TPA: Uma2 family endonuclease [Ktedonobacteraceae bacterium]